MKKKKVEEVLEAEGEHQNLKKEIMMVLRWNKMEKQVKKQQKTLK